MVVIDLVKHILQRAFLLLRLPAQELREREKEVTQRHIDPRRPPAHWEDELLYLLPPFY